MIGCVLCGADTSVRSGVLATCFTCCGVLDAMPPGVREQLYQRLRLGHPPAHDQIVLTHRVVLDSATGGTILAYTTGEGEAQAVQLALLQHPQADARDRLHTEWLPQPVAVRR